MRMQRLTVVMTGCALWLCALLPAGADGLDVSAWVPDGWKMLYQASGDLDGKGGADAVLVLEQTDSSKRVPNAGLGPQELNLNPRRLLVLLDSGTGLAKVAEQDDVLPSEHDRDAPCLEDPLHAEDAVVIRSRTLRLTEHSWTSCGSYGTSTQTLTFRVEPDGKRLRLIGLDYSDMMRNSGEASEISVNFLTGRRKTVTGLDAFEPAESEPKTTWSRIDARAPIHLDGMHRGCGLEGDTQTWCKVLR